jgi:Rho-type GTPase-activating protein 1/2
MARRRKKSRQRQQAANGSTPIVLDKSLPALPPNALSSNAFTPDIDTPPSEAFTETPTDMSPRPRGSRSRKDHSPANMQRDPSPASIDEGGKGEDSSCDFTVPFL